MMEYLPTGSVLGITDFGPVGGTPLIPPSYLTLYFILFLLLLSGLYLYFYRKRQPILLRQKIQLLIVLAFVLKVAILVGGGLVATYWLLPAPGIRRTIPIANSTSFPPTDRIEVVFDRPVDRNTLEKSISPETPGRWVFENSLYTTHLYRKLVFYPTYSFRPDTTYTITLSKIRNLLTISEPYDYQFTITTQTSPKVSAVEPVSGQKEFAPDSAITVLLDNPNNDISNFEFHFEPTFEYDIVLDASKTRYTVVPKAPLAQGVQYNMKVQKTDVILNLEDSTVVERSPSSEIYNGTFTTREAPGISDFQPEGTTVSRDTDIRTSFSKKMDRKSVEENFSITPETPGQFVWIDDTNLSFKPTTLAFDTEYKITISKGTKSLDGSFLEEDLSQSFKTIGSVKVTAFNPESNWSGVSIHSPIRVTFDQEVDKSSAQQKFSITPQVSGTFSWNGNTMTFTPEKPLAFTTAYTVVEAPGVQSMKGRNSTEEFKVSFTTQNATTKLAVPAYLQKYTLSCEIASLRMALSFKGVNVSEDDIIPKVGLDPTPHTGNIWGNPYNAFVGNIRGTQMKDGYGVYWGPIAKAARFYRNAQEFQGWSIGQLTNAIANNNPVVIWVYSHSGIKTSWNTPDGQSIYAVRDEHAVTAVGFVGPPDNPTQLIINDPLIGQVYWSRSSFDKKWDIFGRSGVVVY